jgi:hypothetical protein
MKKFVNQYGDVFVVPNHKSIMRYDFCGIDVGVNKKILSKEAGDRRSVEPVYFITLQLC